MEPTVGRIVYYKSRGSADGKFPPADRAAIVTDVSESEVSKGAPRHFMVRLAVFNPEGMFFTDWLEQGESGGQWDWMPFQKANGANQSQSAVTKN